MIPVSLVTLAEVVGGELVGVKEHVTIERISTDTRSVGQGDLFLALVGERFDGHDFVEQAEQANASAVLVSRLVDTPLPQLMVSDTKTALGQLGAWLRQKLHPTTVAMTGSVGKTTVKEMTAAILGDIAPTLATKGNFNNDIGVPLTLLSLEPEHQYAVIELGANRAGEIKYTSSLVKPKAALINNIQPAHLEGFGSLDGVARAKSEIFESLEETGTAIINLDDDYAPWLMESLSKRNVMTFSTKEVADIWASELTADANGCFQFKLHRGEQQVKVDLPLPGRHQVGNALAAASLTSAIDISLSQIAAGLSHSPQVSGRTQLFALSDSVTVIDDSYNANLASVRAAIDLLSCRVGRKVLVLGDMGELGDEAEEQHRLVGVYAMEKEIDQLFTAGTLSRFAAESHLAATHCDHQQELLPLLAPLIEPGSEPVSILVKGSRSAHMECVVQSLQKMVEEQR